MHTSAAEYWHIGAMTMRLASVTPPTARGVNNLGRTLPYFERKVLN
jgi:hypothetical protein